MWTRQGAHHKVESHLYLLSKIRQGWTWVTMTSTLGKSGKIKKKISQTFSPFEINLIRLKILLRNPNPSLYFLPTQNLDIFTVIRHGQDCTMKRIQPNRMIESSMITEISGKILGLNFSFKLCKISGVEIYKNCCKQP